MVQLFRVVWFSYTGDSSARQDQLNRWLKSKRGLSAVGLSAVSFGVYKYLLVLQVER
jgi:hypothetical protein